MKQNEMNKELLFQLYGIHSMSGSEKKMRRFLRRKAKEYGADSVETDTCGNLLITKGRSDTYPCLAAHMDQVQHNHSKDFRVVEIGDDVIGWSPKCHTQQGLGADDKNGLFICLECLRAFSALKVAFFVGEEVGCTGSSQVDLGFFSDCRFIIEPDRRGSSDLITSMFCGRVCSEEFIRDTCHAHFGYAEEHGTITDVGELVERGVGISCLNLSCGYYGAHTDQEITVLTHLENCLNFVMHIVETCTAVYPFTYSRIDRSWFGGGTRHAGRTSRSHMDWWGRNDDNYYYDSGQYDDDIYMMDEIVRCNPSITFYEVANDYCVNFNTDDEGILRDLYDDARSIYCGTQEQDEDADDEAGTLSFDDITPVRKVS